ncbi:unnamed protein product [Tuber melanosporum]|uniref:(Perigord truffle) hypothetical protein n=1 Tax=Tuber melanosporum (strain Mel28) TaxID=656061 RepID=D5G582_TUBMM|nr:uncharacterized protein GSTUM_00000352001 [Tuber melanosporum]CAZ79675.1 unnamed protein product [Tuber melanosporum]
MFVPKAGSLGELRMGVKVFSKLDFWSGFHQHRMASQDIEKTAFVGPDSLYE